MFKTGLLLVLLTVAPWLNAGQLTVAFAANFSDTIKQLRTAFEASTPYKIRLVPGASGRLYAQIKQGAPFDMFLSADTVKPQALKAEGLIVPGKIADYATGRLVLWSSTQGVNNHTLAAGQFTRLAIANDKHAPYGLAAIQTLKHLGLYNEIKPKLVKGENISQAYQFVKTANAEIGLVALSQIPPVVLKQGRAWLVPNTWHKPITQQMVLLKTAKTNAAALAFWQFMLSDTAKSIIQQSGYEV